MKDLKNNKKKIIILILIFIIILCMLLKIAQAKDLGFQEDLIFFKLFGVENIQENNKESSKLNFKNNNYEIKVKRGENTYKKIDLLQTIDARTLINEKIAPGVKGKFYVYLTSKNDMEYAIKILDKNKRPRNFKFEIEEKEGKLEKNEVKKVEVNWEWPYEINEKENIEDTKDGINLEKYEFEIYTVGK